MVEYILHTVSMGEGTELAIPFGPLHNIVEGHCVISYLSLLFKELDKEVVDSTPYYRTCGTRRSSGVTSRAVVVVSCPHLICSYHEVRI